MRESRERRRWRGAIAIAAVVVVAVIVGACSNPTNSETDEPETYTVSFDANGATSGTAPEDRTKTEGVDLTLASNSGNLARTGYTFAGWNTADDGRGTAYAEGATYSADADVTLYADFTYEIGETGPAGGIVFYDKGSYSDGWRYIEAWTDDEDLFYQWKTETTSTPGTSTDVGSGYANTYSVMTGAEHPAAEAVRNATHGGYDDWFLPSKDELNLMYENLHQEGIGGFPVAGYWSSSEYSSGAAWNQAFDNTGDQYDFGKEYGDKVRAARAF